jgi:DNA-binding transcriptional MocR family regulator
MRALARTLGCALVTVSQAYELLAARGRAIARPGKGTFVSTPPDRGEPFARRWEPDVGRIARGARLEGVMERLTAANEPGAISLATGHPAPETFPLHDFARAFHRTLLDDSPQLMQYRSSTGDAELCGRLASLLRGRGCAADARDVIVCSGAQQAADIVATVLLDERSVVASESPTYWGSLGVFDARGVTYVEVRGDEDGVRTDDVERVFSEYRPRLFYVNPIAQNPTGAVLPARRAKQIVALARRYDVVVLEDQTGWQLTYDALAPPPLAAFDTDGRVIVMESLSKSIFPALRIGYLYAKGGIAEALEAAKVRADVFTSTLTQRALWRFMESPACARHFRTTRALYRKRRDAFVDALSNAARWTAVRSPGAGVNVWLSLPPRISTNAAFEACAREGVLVMPAEPFYPTRSGPPALRLSFGHLTPEEACEGIARLARALTRLGA